MASIVVPAFFGKEIEGFCDKAFKDPKTNAAMDFIHRPTGVYSKRQVYPFLPYGYPLLYLQEISIDLVNFTAICRAVVHPILYRGHFLNNPILPGKEYAEIACHALAFMAMKFMQLRVLSQPDSRIRPGDILMSESHSKFRTGAPPGTELYCLLKWNKRPLLPSSGQEAMFLHVARLNGKTDFALLVHGTVSGKATEKGTQNKFIKL